MKKVKDIKSKEKIVTKEIIKFLKKNKGYAFTREEIIEKTGYDPYNMFHNAWSFDDYEVKDGHYYYKRDLLFIVFIVGITFLWIALIFEMI